MVETRKHVSIETVVLKSGLDTSWLPMASPPRSHVWTMHGATDGKDVERSDPNLVPGCAECAVLWDLACEGDSAQIIARLGLRQRDPRLNESEGGAMDSAALQTAPRADLATGTRYEEVTQRRPLDETREVYVVGAPNQKPFPQFRAQAIMAKNREAAAIWNSPGEPTELELAAVLARHTGVGMTPPMTTAEADAVFEKLIKLAGTMARDSGIVARNEDIADAQRGEYEKP